MNMCGFDVGLDHPFSLICCLTFSKICNPASSPGPRSLACEERFAYYTRSV